MPDTPALVTLHVWGVPRRHIGWAMSRMRHARQPLAPSTGARFSRLLGTSHGRSFTARDADLGLWALLAAWSDAEDAAAYERGAALQPWRERSAECWRIGMTPLSSTGRWGGAQPFGPSAAAARTSLPCAILTRARVRNRHLLTFRKAIPGVAAALPPAPGLLFARGIGEAPLGLQATFSVWQSVEAATDFAYRTPAHRLVVSRTADEGWYAEQLFARFAVVEAAGEIDGRDPLAGQHDPSIRRTPAGGQEQR